MGTASDLSPEEKETVILFNEQDKTAEISTFNGALIRKLEDLCVSRPSECSGHGPNDYGEACYFVPKKWIKINAGPLLSEEQLEKKREVVAGIKKTRH